MSETAAKTPRVVIHIGLHKTGTRFVQREVFARLDATRFNYNPYTIWRAVRTMARFPEDREAFEAARAVVDEWRASGDERTLVLSEPHISGDMYSGHADHRENLANLHALFPEARIIYLVRNPADWLQSAYRQHLFRGRAIPVENFLNWYDGDFQRRVAREVHGSRNIDALSLHFLAIYRDYVATYGAERVYLFRQEDLRHRVDDVRALLAEALGADELPPPGRAGHNRSYSALAIHLFHPGVWWPRRRPTEKDVGGIPPHWVRKSLMPGRRLRRLFIQHLFDRVFYRDRDLLAPHGMRERLEAYYAEENAELGRIAARILENGPSGGSGHP